MIKKILTIAGFLAVSTMAHAQACIWTDNPKGPSCSIVPQKSGLTLGTAARPFSAIYGPVIGGQTLANNTYLKSVDAAGTGTNNLLKSDTSNNTVLNAPTGSSVAFSINGVIGGAITNASAQFPFPMLATAFNLADNSDKNYTLSSYAAGTAYTLTAVAAALDFGTTDPSITVNKAGTYAIRGKVTLNYTGATFAAGRTVTLKLRRTNNTAADLTNGTTTVITAIVTTVTATFMVVELPEVIYTTALLTDIITIFGDVSVVPTAGTFDADSASIVATRLY